MELKMTREEFYKSIIEKIANFDENLEDYYGGVAINYGEAFRDIVNLAKRALNDRK